MSGPLDQLLDAPPPEPNPVPVVIPPTPDPQPVPVPAPTPAPAPAPVDPLSQLLDQSPPPTAGMRAAAVASEGVSTGEGAQAAAVARRSGMRPAAMLGVSGQVVASPVFDAAHYDDIAARHPELAHWLSDPAHAAIARGDLAQLRAVSTAAQGLTQPTQSTEPTDPLPLTGAFRFGVERSLDSLNKTLSSGPAWVQQEARSLLGITSAPTYGTPLSIFQDSVDRDREMERVRATYAPSAMRDLVSQTAGILADPTTSLLLPAEGASLAIKGSQVLGEAALASQAIKGAAITQAVTTAGQTAIASAERRQQDPAQAGSVLADAANTAVQSALAFFFGKAGQEIPVLRALHQTTFGAAPIQELGSDILRNAVVGGSQAATGGIAESVLHGQGIPDAGSLMALYASGAIPGGLLAAGSVHEAVIASRHLESLRHAETLQFANKMSETIAAVQASKAAQASPEEVGRLLDAIAERAAQQGGLSHVYLQSGDFQEHFLAKGLDPVAEAQKAGLGEEYVRARGLGGDMQIPIRAAIGMGMDAENPAALVAKMRPAANAPTAGEAATYFQAQEAPTPEELAKAKSLAAEQIAAAEGTPEEAASLRERIRSQAIAAGEPAERAEALAQIHQRFATRMAAHFNASKEPGATKVSAQDIADQFPLDIQRRLPGILDEALSSGSLGKILETLRTAGPENPQLLAARESLRGLGLDPLTQTDEQIHAALQKRLGASVEEIATGHVAKGHPVVLADVPYGGGTSADGKTVYIDRRIPRFHDFTLPDGTTKRLDLHQMIAEHEIAEKQRMDRGESYSKAHGQALGIEDATVDHQGIDHATYESILKPYLAEAKAGAAKEGIPADLETKPYHDMGEAGLIDGAKGPTFEQASPVHTGIGRAMDRFRVAAEAAGLTEVERAKSPRSEAAYITFKDADGEEFSVRVATHAAVHDRSLRTVDVDPRHVPSEEAIVAAIQEWRATAEVDAKSHPWVRWADQRRSAQRGRAAGHTTGIENPPGDDLVTAHGPTFDQRVPVAAGMKLTDSEALRARAEAERRGELAQKVDPNAATGRFPILRQGEVPRGTFQPPRLPGGKSLISLLADANASTVFHESAHYFLEVMGQLADRPDAPQALKDDFQTVMAWSGYGDRAGMVRSSEALAKLQAEVAGREPTAEEKAQLKALADPHETFARGFERYLMEGVAPAKGLRRAFAQIKTWMLNVYKDVRGLNVEINPEVRAVFDRMLASDREIASARRRVSDEPAFKSIEETKWTPEKWGKYQELVANAHQAEADDLERSLMDVVRKTQSDAYAAERKTVREHVADQVAQERVHNAIRQLQDGETWDGRPIAEPIKIAKDDVEKLLTPEEMKRLPGPKREKNAGRVIYTPEEHGMKADDVAKRLGYTTGHEMLQDILAAPDRQARIDEVTDAAMKARYPDPMDHQATMDHNADLALHAADIRANLMEVEREHLAELARDSVKEGRAALKAASSRDERQTMRVAAGEMIRDTKLSAFDPERFVAAERKAAIGLSEALARKDYEKALAMKRAQMMNAELARAAFDAQEQAAKDQKHLRRAATDGAYRAQIGKAGGWEWTVTYPDGSTKIFDSIDEKGRSSQEQAREEAINAKGTYERISGYLDQIDNLLEAFEFKDITPKEARRRASLAAWLEKVRFVTLPDGERVPTGEQPNIPQELIDKAGKTSYRDLTVADLSDLRAAVESIETMAKLKNKLILSTGKAERGAIMAECAAQLRIDAQGRKRKVIVNRPSRFAPFDSLRKMTGTFFNELRSVPSLCYEMDGFKEGGALYRSFVEPAQRAADTELNMKAEGRKQFAEAIEAWGKKDELFRSTIPGIDEPMTRLERVVALMHYGNKEGRQRLLALKGWDDAKVHAIVDSLDAKDIAFANRMVEVLSSHWSEAKALEERYQGVAPPKVEAIPVDLPNGRYNGGYQRIYYDGESATQLEHMAQHAAEEGLTGAGIRRSAKTPAGAMNARAEEVKDRKLSLDPGNWARAYNEMVHDLTHRDVVMNQMKLLRAGELKDAMIAHWGTGVFQQFVHETMGLAQGNKPASTSLEKAAEYLRVTSNYSRRAFNPAYALIQEMGMPLSITRVGARHIASAMLQLYSGPLCIDHTSHWIMQQSTAMRFRSRTRDANFGDALSETALSGSARKFMDGAGMFMVLKTWEHLDNVCWKGAYDQHMEQSGGDHSAAVHVADQIVESVMGSSKQKDLPQIMRAGGPMFKVFTSNMNWALANWNQIAAATNQFGGGLKNLGHGGFGQMAKGLGSLATLMVVGPMLWDWMQDEMKGEDMKGWTTAKGLATKIVAAPVYAAMSSVPIARDLAPAVIEGRNQHGGTVGLNWLKALQGAASALHQKHYKEGTAKAVAGGAATFLPLPSAALFQAFDGYRYAERHNAGFAETVWRMMNGTPIGGKR